jgi:hypothetical protein
MVDRLNLLSILLFVVGAVCFMVFSASNLNGDLSVAGKENKEQKDDSEKRGYRPLERPVPAPQPKPTSVPSTPPPKTK